MVVLWSLRAELLYFVDLGLVKAERSRLDADRDVGDQIEQTIAAMEVHFEVGQLRNLVNGGAELLNVGLEWVHADVVIDHQAQP